MIEIKTSTKIYRIELQDFCADGEPIIEKFVSRAKGDPKDPSSKYITVWIRDGWLLIEAGDRNQLVFPPQSVLYFETEKPTEE